MKLKNLRTDDSAVSPVIGVILMVAITVILAAVIGTFVLNLGNQVQTTAPSASFSFDETDGGDVEITHDGGDSIPQSNLNVTVGGSVEHKSGDNSGDDYDGTDWNSADGSDASAGSSVTIDSPDDTVRVIWESDNGQNSQVLAEYTP